MNNFAAIILTHGRPDKVITYKTLRKSGYTGKIILLVDNLDETKEKYVKKYGNEVVIFNKKEIAKTFDTADNFDDMRTIVYARNACFKLGIEYFIQLDDDYTSFDFRYNNKGEYCYKTIKNIDIVFKALLDFYKETPIKSIAFSQGGDFIGGKDSSLAQGHKLKRKCMNSFICSTNRPFQFLGRINEDVNTYTKMASIGQLFFTTNFISLKQKQSQSNSGGMTDVYLDSGTYVKSFYSVIFQPSSVKIGSLNNRLHHAITWRDTVPKILSEEIKNACT